MEKIINSLGFLFILTEFVILILSYCYSIKQYKHVMISYKKKQNTRPQIYVSRSDDNNYSRTVIKSNMTERFNTQDIENKLFIPILCFYVNGRKTKLIKLNGNRENIFIGRSKSDDIIIDETTVSRAQCCITRDNGKFFISVDTNKNPVYLNDKLLKTKAILQNKDTVSMANGKIYYIFYSSEKEMSKLPKKDTN